MYPNLRQITLLSIFSFTLLSLTACGEKRIHVATVSGAPGDELILDPMTGNVEAQPTSGQKDTSIDESALLSQTTDGQEHSAEPTTSAMDNMDNEPISMAHETTSHSNPDEPSEPFPADSMANSLESEFSDNNNPFAALGDGQSFSTQSGSSTDDPLSPSSTNFEDFREPVTSQHSDTITAPFSQDSSSGLQDTLSRDGLEPLPDTFQIAKAEPSDSLQDQMKRIKEEEFARMARLQDVFFQFDSWALTPEGKKALEQTQKWFEQAPSSNLIIEGHADQRGTQAYNMVLAKKRAVAVQDYLSQLGVDDSRMAIISYGKDKPFCQDVTEACHQLNRRGHLLVQKK